MKRILFTLLTIAILSQAKAQSFTTHGFGIILGFDSDQKKSFSPEYEISILNNSSGYEKGFVAGAGVSFPFDNKALRERGYYLKGGYKLGSFSFGANGGFRTDFDFDNGKATNSLLAGGWVGFNVIKQLKLTAGADNFNGFKVGLIFLPNTVGGNR